MILAPWRQEALARHLLVNADMGRITIFCIVVGLGVGSFMGCAGDGTEEQDVVETERGDSAACPGLTQCYDDWRPAEHGCGADLACATAGRDVFRGCLTNVPCNVDDLSNECDGERTQGLALCETEEEDCVSVCKAESIDEFGRSLCMQVCTWGAASCFTGELLGRTICREVYFERF